MDTVYPNASLGGAGTAGRLAKYTGSLTLADSIASEAGTVLTVAGTELAANGTAAVPSYAFTNSPTTGMYRVSANVIGFSIAGLNKGQLSATTLLINAQATATNTVIWAAGSFSSFLQYDILNQTAATGSQSGYSCTADNGTSTTGFNWLGINNSGPALVAQYNIGSALDSSLLSSSRHLYIANAIPEYDLIYCTGSGSANSSQPWFIERMRMSNTSGVTITGPMNQPAPGQGFGGMIGVVLFGQFAATPRLRTPLSPFLN